MNIGQVATKLSLPSSSPQRTKGGSAILLLLLCYLCCYFALADLLALDSAFDSRCALWARAPNTQELWGLLH